MDNQDLKYIKKHYGENFAKLCRELFPTILEEPGVLTRIITQNFEPQPELFDDMSAIKDKFKRYIFSFFKKEKENKVVVNKTPEQLLDEAGYKLFPECKTEYWLQTFKKYYANGEELCTFYSQRLDTCRVWFAVKKNVDEIRRKDFKEPKRQDEYGTSVISIQFTKGEYSTLSIKNRYNHSVDNPDATFGNNLDNIIPGLTEAFCREYNIKLMNDKALDITTYNDKYILAKDGKLYKLNCTCGYEYFYCANNKVIAPDKSIISFDKSKYLLLDGYLLDLVNKTIVCLPFKDQDAFTKSIGNIKSIKITLDENKNRVIDIMPEQGTKIQIVANKSNQIIKYTNENIKVIEDEFLAWNESLQEINIPNVEKIGHEFLIRSEHIKDIYLPKVKEVGSYFMFSNLDIEKIDMPELKKIAMNFFGKNVKINKVNLPKVETIGDRFLYLNRKLRKIDLPNVKNIEYKFLYSNLLITSINFPNVETIENGFMYKNVNIKKVNLPNVKKVGSDFLICNKNLRYISIPKAEEIGDNFLKCNVDLKSIKLPDVKKIGDAFLEFNENLLEISLPKIETIGENFLLYNKKINVDYITKITQKTEMTM